MSVSIGDTGIPGSAARRALGAHRALRLHDAGGLLTTEEIVEIIVHGTWGRLGFALLIAAIATAVLPWTYALGWGALMTFWELLGRRWCDGFAVRLSRQSQERGVYALAVINFVGGCAYGLFPLMAWMTNTPIGTVLATGWVCASATHAFVYFASHRPILIGVLIPIAAIALIAPFAVSGFTPMGAVGAVALSCLVLSAGMVGRDREMLLSVLAGQMTARVEAEQSDRAKSQFLATMSHELRTPLNAIIGYSEMIEEEGGGDVAEDASKIKTSARQLLGVINSILEVSKLEAGGVEIEKDRVALTGVVDEIREAAAPLAAANNNAIVVEEVGVLGVGELDHARLHQCAMHLIANAAKFTRDGAIRITISKTMRDGRPVVQFVVADTGIGVPEDQRERIFEPFAQVETGASRRFEGAGLGLTFARRVARLMDGDVVCEPSGGRGATFRLWVAA